MSVIVVSGTAGAWSVAVWSACAHSAAVSGALLLSAARARVDLGVEPGSQNSDQFALPIESGTKDWQAKLVWITCAEDGYRAAGRD